MMFRPRWHGASCEVGVVVELEEHLGPVVARRVRGDSDDFSGPPRTARSPCPPPLQPFFPRRSRPPSPRPPSTRVVEPAGDRGERPDGCARGDRGQRVLGAGADADVGDAARRHERPRREVRRGGSPGMSAIFEAGDSTWRGSPPLSPHPAKSNVSAVYPPAGPARSHSGRPSAPSPVNHEPVTTTPGRRSNRSPAPYNRPASQTPPAGNTAAGHRHVEHARNGNVFVSPG